MSIDWNTITFDDVTMSTEWENMDDGSQGFFYQPDQAYEVEANDNDENLGGDDIDMHSHPNYPDFFQLFHD